MNISIPIPHAIKWDYFTNYHKNCDNFSLDGGVYGLVFHPTKPEPWSQPCEFEQCVYIGKSTGSYIDRQSGSRERLRSNIHKRMIDHLTPMMSGKCVQNSHKSIVEKYGYGEDVLNGITTGLPLWLCIMTPPPVVITCGAERVSRWALTLEQLQLYSYEMKFDHTTIGNKDAKRERKIGSFSSTRVESIMETNLERFF